MDQFQPSFEMPEGDVLPNLQEGNCASMQYMIIIMASILLTRQKYLDEARICASLPVIIGNGFPEFSTGFLRVCSK